MDGPRASKTRVLMDGRAASSATASKTLTVMDSQPPGGPGEAE